MAQIGRPAHTGRIYEGCAMERNDQDLRSVGGPDHTLSRPSVPTADGGLEGDRLLTPGEVARLFGVDPKTVSRWADAGKLNALRTLGGHRRYRADEVQALLED